MKIKMERIKKNRDKIEMFWPRRNKAKMKRRMAIIELITFPILFFSNLFII